MPQLSHIGEDSAAVRTALEAVVVAGMSGSSTEAQLDPAIESWVNHLFYLRERIDIGLLPPGELQAVESRGLMLLNQVLEELKGRTKCPHCHLPSKTFTHCEHCKRPIPAQGKS